MVRADGSVIINTQINTQGFGKGAQNLKSQFGSLGAATKKLGGIIAAAFSVKAIVSFGKEAIELGSDLQEVQNVVDVTFSTMSDKVNEFARNAAMTAGLSETMAKRYVGTFGAMSKSFGFTETEAYNMSTALTQLAGDVASFYNLSQDEAYTKLKSVFTGETESLKDLGVVMTQTALDDFALRKGFGKTVQQMTEQEKVALRYQFVLEQLSGASSDFVRTQDSWANQTRILSLQFDQLKATIGQGLINVLTPVLKLINQLIGKIQQFAVAFKNATVSIFGDASGASGGIAKTMGVAAENADALTDGITDAGKAAKRALAGFDEITKITGASAENTLTMENGFSGSKTGIEGGAYSGAMTSMISDVIERIKELIKPLNDISFSPLLSSLSSVGAGFMNLGKTIAGALEWAWFNLLVPFSEWVIEDAAPASINLLSSAIGYFSSALEPAWDGAKKLFEYLKPAFAWLGETAVWAIQKLQDRFERFTEVFRERGSKIESIFSGIGEAFSVVWNLAKPILEELREYWGVVFDYISDKSANNIGAIIDLLSGLVNFIAGVFTGDWKRALNGILQLFNAVISWIVTGVNDAIKALNKISIDVPSWVPVIGGQTFGFNIKTLPVPQIPYLAKGAVIPPNAPFAAILGDQRHGTNIEAPLSTIQEAVALVMQDFAAENMAGHEATVGVLRQILSAVLGIEIGDDVIGRAAARYNAEKAISEGGLV